MHCHTAGSQPSKEQGSKLTGEGGGPLGPHLLQVVGRQEAGLQLQVPGLHQKVRVFSRGEGDTS